MGNEQVPSASFDIRKLEGDYDGTQASKMEYFKDRIRRVKSGEPTWIVRNFEAREYANTDMGNGIIYDYYVDGKLVGMIDCSQSYTEAYALGGGEQRVLGTESQDLASTVELVERACGATN